MTHSRAKVRTAAGTERTDGRGRNLRSPAHSSSPGNVEMALFVPKSATLRERQGTRPAFRAHVGLPARVLDGIL